MPPDIVLRTPEHDVAEPELSIVVPALNEEIAVGQFVDWCRQGLDRAGVVGEILIVDSSTDRTAEIALSRGARVLKTPKRGLGRAYIDAIPFIRGRYVLMGDADCTYDFRELSGFVERFRAGDEFIMGSRFKGSIQHGAMPPLHRYFGTPLTTWILNVMYGTRFSDIHCGMRGLTRDALERMGLASQSWEYASEMVLKSVHLDLRTSEVPVSFLKDPEGRVSHLVRGGWLSPWRAGLINLKAMFVFGADFFLTLPGLLLLLLGFVPLCLLATGPITVSGVTLSLNAMLFCLAVSVMGLQMLLIGLVAKSLYDGTGRKRRRLAAIFSYAHATIAAVAAFVIGFLLVLEFVLAFIGQNYVFTSAITAQNHHAVFGTFLMMGSVLIFVTTLLIHAVDLYVPLARGSGRAGHPQ